MRAMEWLTKYKTIIIMTGIFLVLLFFGVLRNNKTGIMAGDRFLSRKSAEYYSNGTREIRIEQDQKGTVYYYKDGDIEKKAKLEWTIIESDIIANKRFAQILFDEDTVIEGQWDENGQYLHKDGLPLSFSDDLQISYFANGEWYGDTSLSNITLANIFCRIDLGHTDKNGYMGVVAVGALCYWIGVLTFCYPEKMYFLGKRWRYKNAELSADGVLMEQLGAVVVMLLGALVMLRIVPLG